MARVILRYYCGRFKGFEGLEAWYDFRQVLVLVLDVSRMRSECRSCQ
jgi:hypothetical protein